jgi:hypothetical protein
MILDIELVKWNQGKWSNWIITLGGQIGDQYGNILFQLGQVRDDIAFIEIEPSFIMLFVCN